MWLVTPNYICFFFFLIKVKKKYYFNNTKITLDHLVYCLCKGLHFPPSWLIPVFENSFPTYFSPPLLRLPVFGYHEHISVKCLPTKMTTFSSHCGLLSLLILHEVLPCLTSEINSRSLSPLEKLRQGKHGDSKLCKTGREL